MADGADMRWWGWGDPAHQGGLPEHAVAFLRDQLEIPGVTRPPVALEQVVVQDSHLGSAARDALAGVLGADGLREDHAVRVLHAGGKGYRDLVEVRSGQPDGAPDAVAFPSGHEQVAAVLAACASHDTAVVPFGGGTSVVGGVSPLRGSHAAVIALDLRRLSGPATVDHLSRTALVGAGVRGPALERDLEAHGLTLGHYPQSYEHVSIGGCVATRSAGQASTGYGRIEDRVLGLRCATPVGEIALPARPASAAGPELRELIVGSEGAFGVITEVALRLAPRPRQRSYEGIFFHSFQEGAEALRAIAQQGAASDIARLSDQQETRLSMMLAGSHGLKARLGRAYLSARRYSDGCLAILGWEGSEQEVERRRALTISKLREHGGLALGASPGRSWSAGRYAGPYLRDDLLDHGVMVETLETATQWSGITSLYGAVRGAIESALEQRGTPPFVMCHISHLYETGASLYFTFLARQQEGQEIEQWQAAKTAACDAIVSEGATITHHHAIGRDHAAWLAAEDGPRGIAALRAVKQELDPHGIMNPGKLLTA